MSEADARAKLASAEERLTRYERVLGEGMAGAEAAKNEVERLELKLSESDAVSPPVGCKLFDRLSWLTLDGPLLQATDALYSELERLSKAWEEAMALSLPRAGTVKETEDKLARLATEKAKADNKYFAAMRQKEAVEGEKRGAMRLVEKQVHAIDRLSANEKNLAGQLVRLRCSRSLLAA